MRSSHTVWQWTLLSRRVKTLTLHSDLQRAANQAGSRVHQSLLQRLEIKLMRAVTLNQSKVFWLWKRNNSQTFYHLWICCLWKKHRTGNKTSGWADELAGNRLSVVAAPVYERWREAGYRLSSRHYASRWCCSCSLLERRHRGSCNQQTAALSLNALQDVIR